MFSYESIKSLLLPKKVTQFGAPKSNLLIVLLSVMAILGFSIIQSFTIIQNGF